MSMIRINWDPPRRTLRQFGLIALAVFGGLAAWAVYKHKLGPIALSDSAAPIVGYTLGSLALICGLLAAVAPSPLRWLYVGMSLAAFPIGFVVSHVILGVIYFGLFTPIALFFRITGRDALERAYAPQAATYWVPRTPVTDVRRYFRQY
jgi:hypothetical protein